MKHHLYLKLALDVAKEGTCPRAKVGAVLVQEGRPVALGYNGAPRGVSHCKERGCLMVGGHCRLAVHAELNAILNAAYTGTSTKNSALYCTHKPCIECLKSCINAGVLQVLYLKPYNDGLANNINSRMGVLRVKEDGSIYV